MSTTTDKKIAIKYGQDWVKERGLSHVLELPMDSLNRECWSHALLKAPSTESDSRASFLQAVP